MFAIVRERWTGSCSLSQFHSASFTILFRALLRSAFQLVIRALVSRRVGTASSAASRDRFGTIGPAVRQYGKAMALLAFYLALAATIGCCIDICYAIGLYTLLLMVTICV